MSASGPITSVGTKGQVYLQIERLSYLKLSPSAWKNAWQLNTAPRHENVFFVIFRGQCQFLIIVMLSFSICNLAKVACYKENFDSLVCARWLWSKLSGPSSWPRVGFVSLTQLVLFFLLPYTPPCGLVALLHHCCNQCLRWKNQVKLVWRACFSSGKEKKNLFSVIYSAYFTSSPASVILEGIQHVATLQRVSSYLTRSYSQCFQLIYVHCFSFWEKGALHLHYSFSLVCWRWLSQQIFISSTLNMHVHAL